MNARQLSLDGELTEPAAVRRRRPPAADLIARALKAAGASGLLVEEIAKHTHLPLSSVAARVGELLRRAEILPVVARSSSAGRPAWAFALPALLSPGAAQQGHANAKKLIAARGRWFPASSPADVATPGRVKARVLSVQAEGDDATVAAALKAVGEILGT